MKNIFSSKASVSNQIVFSVLLVPALLAGFLLAKPALAVSWATSSGSMIIPRGSFASTVVNDKIYVFGGDLGGPFAISEVESYDPVSDVWKEEPSLSESRWGLTAATVDGKIVTLVGGSPIPYGSVTTELYDPSTGEIEIGAIMPSPGWGATAASVKGKVYVIGGYNWPEWGQAHNREYDPVKNEWKMKTPMPTRRSWLSAEVVNDKIYVLGGWNWNDSIDLPTLEAYDPETDTWETKASLPIGMKGVVTAVLGTKIYAIGGGQGEGGDIVVFNTVFVYDTKNDAAGWVKQDEDFPVKISGGGAETINGTIYVFGGGSGDGLVNRTYYLGDRLELKKLNPVILIPGFFGSGETNGQLELDPILHTYNNLWEALKLAGYEKDKTLFAFPYNWRQSNITSSLLLKQKIDEVKTACVSANLDGYDCNKVDLVAHSMGGIVARAYAESNDYEDDIDQLIFLATPQRGSPMSYLAWEGGEAGVKLEDTVLEKILLAEADENGYLTTFSYIRNLPMTSVQEVLPIFNYLRDKGSDSLRTYPYDNYPRNLFLENLNDSYNLAKLQNIKILNIVADSGNNRTANAFRVVSGGYSDGRWEHGYPEDYGRLFTDRGLEYGEGDNTVPAISNRGFNGFDEVLFNNSNHLNIVSDAQGFVIEELTGSRPSQEVSKNFIQKIFMARIFSPADFLITAPDGKRIGKDFTTGQNINEIDGAYYSGKFATIPNPLDGEYKVELQGTGNGEYKLSISGIDDATSTDKDFVGQITTGAIQDFKIDYSSSSPNLLEDLQPQDTISPSLTINSPLDSVEYKHNEKMVINYDASDDFSGVSLVVIKIDDKEISSTTVNLFDYQIGMHSLSVVALDNAGNFTEKKVNFKIVADIKSTIADIEEVYDRDWLKGLSRKNILIGELKILESALNLIDRAKVETIKKIEDAKNNPKLSARAKERLITSLNSILVGLDENRQKVVSLNLGIFEKTLNEFKKSNYLNQGGYDVLKSDSEYLKINL